MALTQVSRGLLSTSIVDNGNATAITIDSSENVGIGTSSPATLLELSANNDGAAANNTLRFTDTDTGTEANQQIGKIEFKSNDSSGDGALVRSYILSASEDTTPSSYISFGTNPGGAGNTTDERMRIDASGNVLVGKTSTGDYVTGIEMQPAGAILSYRTSGVASIFGRTDDGEITRFTRNGSVLGGIGARTSSQLYIALGSTGLTGSSTGGGALIPTSGGTSYTDAAVDLGFSSGRFKDLYLSSKVRLQYPGNSYYARVEVDSSTNLIFGAGANGAEGMRLSSGNLLVGTTSGTGKLEVYEAANNTEAAPHFRITGAGYSGFHFLDGSAYYIGQNSSARALRLYSGAETAGVNLSNGGTSWGTFSDERLKYDVEPVENALESLSKLRTVKYRLKNVDGPDSQKKIGVIAQDLVGVIDEVIDPLQITGDDTEYMAVRYTELVPVLVKAIQEQQETITAFTARIEQLENN